MFYKGFKNYVYNFEFIMNILSVICLKIKSNVSYDYNWGINMKCFKKKSNTFCIFPQ